MINLPKVEWKYVFEFNKTKVAGHHQKAIKMGLPGIPYLRNSGTGHLLNVNKEDVAYGTCGPHFFCSEDSNAKKGIHFLPINVGVRRIKTKVIFA